MIYRRRIHMHKVDKIDLRTFSKWNEKSLEFERSGSIGQLAMKCVIELRIVNAFLVKYCLFLVQ